MSSIVLHLDSVRRFILSSNVGKRITNVLEKCTGLAVEHIVGGIEMLLLLFIFCGLGASFITNAVGIIYPAYCSIRAIETNGKDDDTEWLIYWIVYAGFSTMEYFIDYIIFWIPFFYPLKVCFLIWCFSPEHRGANRIYVGLIPLFRSNQESLLSDSDATGPDTGRVEPRGKIIAPDLSFRKAKGLS